MKKKQRSIEDAWTNERRIYWTGKHHRLDHDSQIPKIVVRVDDLMHEIANSRGKQFHVEKGKRGQTAIKLSEIAQALLDSVQQLNPHLVRRYETRHEFSPYFEVWERIWQEALTLPEVIRRPGSVEILNEWFHQLRAELRTDPFRKVVNNQRRVARKNAAGLKRHLNRLFELCSRLLVIRIDFGYRHEPETDVESWVPPTDKDVKADLEQLKRFVRDHIPHYMSFIWKLEYGAIKGHHVHAIVICNGNRVRQGISWGKVIGEKWEEITHGAGSYWNSNANEALFEKQGRRGIGLIHRDDMTRREALMGVAMYVAKSDYYARFVSPDIKRTFGKSKCQPLHERRSRLRKQKALKRKDDPAKTAGDRLQAEREKAA